MASTSGFRTRSPVKQNLVLEALRTEIIQGKFGPGERLPTRSELERRFQVSNATLQRALDRLMSEGFIYAKGTMGTYVSDKPPHVAHIGLVLPHTANEEGWNRFFAALSSEAMKFEEESGRKMTVYCGGGGHADNPDFARLVRHVRQHRVAGLIFAHPLGWYQNTPVLTEPGIARVAMYTPLPTPGVVMVRLARETLVKKGMAELAGKGRQRLAIICSGSDAINKPLMDSWLQMAATFNLSTGYHWIQGSSLDTPGNAANIARLLMFAPPEQRPDAIMILDDNLVEPATAGLVAAGVRVPDDVEIVAHCNFPWPTPSVVPSTRIGFNNTDVLRRCVALIDMICRGETPPPVTEISAVREDEVAEPSAY